MSLETHAKEYENLMKPIKLVSRFVALWPLERNSGAKRRLLRTCHFLLIMSMVHSQIVLKIVSLAALIVDTIRHLNDMEEAIERSLFGCCFLLCCIRLPIYRYRQDDILYVTEVMEADWTNASREEAETLRSKCLSGYRLSKFFIVTVFSTLLTFIFLPVLEILLVAPDARTMAFHGDYYFFNQSSSPTFECLYVFNAVAGGFAGSVISGATTFNLVTVIHASAKFAVVRRKLEAIRSDDPDAKVVLKECVKRHQEAIAFADTCERVINLVALAQFVTSTCLLCFAGFQISAMMEHKSHLVKYGGFLMSTTAELFLYSVSGQELIDESKGVGDSVYQGDWPGCGYTKNLYIIIMRSRTNSRITAAKFYDMSLQSFSAVLSSSFSYLTMLLSIKNK